MQRKYKIRYNEWLLVSFGWIIVFYLYFIFSWWGIESFLKDNWMLEYMNSLQIHFEIIIQAIVFGLFFNIINTIVSKSALGKKSFGMVILLKSILYFSALTFSQAVVSLIFFLFDILPVEQFQQAIDMMTFEFVMSLFIYFTISIMSEVDMLSTLSPSINISFFMISIFCSFPSSFLLDLMLETY